MGTVKTELNPPHPVSLRSTVRSHGWVMLAPWGWDDSAGVLWRSDRLSSGRVARIQATQPDAARIDVAVDSDGLSSSDVDEAACLVKRWLSLDWDPAGAVAAARNADAEAAKTIEGGGGRLLRSSTFYEDFVKTVCTIQIAWSGSRRMVAALVEAGDGLFPTPATIMDLGEAGLRERGVGFRARALAEGTEKMLDRGLIDETGRAAERARLLRRPDRPVGDRPLRGGAHGRACSTTSAAYPSTPRSPPTAATGTASGRRRSTRTSNPGVTSASWATASRRTRS